ncbi:MAG: indole-3-glycerol-phosphate synthase [Actinomycetia bacterium]|nr:indole-3-glycerol-phosphate synthase [Actinomycetes bacterium]
MSGPFSAALRGENAQGFLGVIPDLKCASPKEGDLLVGRDPVAFAAEMVAGGARVLSVVTAPGDFGGSEALLADVVAATGVPVLRKDFITTPVQVEAAAALGASAVLLICSLMDERTLTRLAEVAAGAGLEALVEAHTADELAWARRLGADLVGINNRDITAGETDDGGVERTSALAGLVPGGTLLVSESGIATRSDAESAALAGADAVLVGTALWRADDPVAALAGLRVRWRGRSCDPS